MVRMVDVDNDGKTDMVLFHSDGLAKVWKNIDQGRKFKPLDAKWTTSFHQPPQNVQFRHMDGDGDADYVILYEEGAVDWVCNTQHNGKDDKKRNWEKAVAIAPGPASKPNNRAQTFHLDGDDMAGESRSFPQITKLFLLDEYKNQLPDKSKSGFNQIHCSFLGMLCKLVLRNPLRRPGAKEASEIPIQHTMQRQGRKGHWNDVLFLERLINHYKENVTPLPSSPVLHLSSATVC
ncbi:hypothetical protein ABOM_008415 [Aspergillus bombycis]|uniref:Uncharacterized protein n=1 Tax=Aspergillus bombycis TaxID=109264 RepID=A0A1F7ZU87_9EURO|nr:hypothetical protein ABOM_008415 [Aspergillus bombycis]OGM42648.1 hypothetical protein ABOM_008415 [Aspergillus bombycis]